MPFGERPVHSFFHLQSDPGSVPVICRRIVKEAVKLYKKGMQVIPVLSVGSLSVI